MATANSTPAQSLGKEGPTYRRFDIHQLVQHWIMVASFITLVLTGWPLRTGGEGGSAGLVTFFGSLHACATIHRIAAVGLIVSGGYHLLYLIIRWRKKQLGLAIAPALKDFRDLRDNFLYFVGLRKEPPAFDRYSYIEKFDYWAVFWGMFIMIGSGFVLWFPVWTMSFLPAWVLTMSMIAHSDEALLAALAIFIWHFYNVHLRRTVFPMSWVWLTGTMTEEEMKRDHGVELSKLEAEKRAKTDESTT